MNDERLQECKAIVRSIVGMTLAHAFVTVKSHGLVLQVKKLDDEFYHGTLPVRDNTVSVIVSEGIVTRSWLGSTEERYR